MSELFKIILALISYGKIDGIRHKINTFYANNDLTEREYNILLQHLNNAENTLNISES